MKKGLTICLVLGALLFLFSGSAMAVPISITYLDKTDSWPGYTPYGEDEFGGPKIVSMVVTFDDVTRDLESVLVNLTDRRVFDSLFINTGGVGSYEAWDYYVWDGTVGELDPPTNAKMYTVAAAYNYKTAAEAGHPSPPRGDHPVGFDTGITEIGGLLISVSTVPEGVLYKFNSGIVLQEGFVIGYTPYCANDVILTPEPMSLLLLGVGLMGIAGLRRKFEI